MHFTGTVYRNPYWPTWPLLEITQGCTHNSCKFCTMYKDVPFRMSPMEWIEEDLRELSQTDPDATTIQLLSANPLVLSYDKLAPILEMIKKYLPKMEYVYLAGRVTDLRNKTVEELKKLKDLGMREISLGVESGDDWTLDRIHKLFNAPALVYLTLGKGHTGWPIYDLGGFGMTLMLAAKDHGVDSIPAYEIVKFPAELRPLLSVPEDEEIVMGIALGYADEDSINDFSSTRLPLEDILTIKL